jgi:4-alpha-glucanotransferase
VKVARRRVLDVLAERAGILPSYRDQAGRLQRTTDRTRRALLAALRIDASTEASAMRALDRLRAAERDRVLPPVRVVDEAGARTVRLDPGRHRAVPGGVAEWEVELEDEGGVRRRIAGRVRRSAPALTALRFTEPVPAGYHAMRVCLRGSGGHRVEAEQQLIVSPGRCPAPRETLGQPRAYGVLAQLYALASDANWGIGDFGDLRRLVGWCGKIGAAFVGLNPLHALANQGDEISPYSPLSRLYRSILYLDIDAIPEVAQIAGGRGRLDTPAFRRELANARAGDHVQYDRILALKRPVLRALHRSFVARHRTGRTARGRAYRRYVAAEGESLLRFATFVVLREHCAPRYGRDWRKWPLAYRDPASPAVQAFAAEHAEHVDFQCYMQFELDRQLGLAAARARAAGLAVGLYQDLAIGSSPVGSDAWGFSDVFVDGVTMGAPPDLWYAHGQDWGFHPASPGRMAATGYRYWVRLLRAAMGHAGALRIDHILGLFRQFWIPAGRPASEGAYVRFPAADLLGILALESSRAGALVIGEDLGTVPPGVPSTLKRWGVLSTSVLYLAKDKRGAFLPARAYPATALASANTHDMAPVAGYWRGRDVELREATGQFRSRAAARQAHAERAAERRALLRRLARDGVLDAAHEPSAGAGLRGAIHTFLGRTPAALVGVSLDDLTGEIEPVNLPGVTGGLARNWSRRLRLPVDKLPTDRDVATALGDLPRSGRARRRTP